MSPGVRNYAYVLAFTVIGLIVSAVAGLYLLSSYQSDGLSSDEILALFVLTVGAVTQVSVLLNNKQTKDARKELNGKLDGALNTKLEQQRQDIQNDRREDLGDGR